MLLVITLGPLPLLPSYSCSLLTECLCVQGSGLCLALCLCTAAHLQQSFFLCAGEWVLPCTVPLHSCSLSTEFLSVCRGVDSAWCCCSLPTEFPCVQGSGFCLVLLSSHAESFFKLAEAAEQIQIQLKQPGVSQVCHSSPLACVLGCLSPPPLSPCYPTCCWVLELSDPQLPFSVITTVI